MPVQLNNYDDVIHYHTPTPDQVVKIQNVRAAGRELIKAILENTIVCGDQQAAIRHVREATMTANAAIVLKGLV